MSGRLTISGIDFKDTSGVTQSSLGNDSLSVLHFTLKNTSSSLNMTMMSVRIDFLNSSGSVVGSGFVIGTDSKHGTSITSLNKGSSRAFNSSTSGIKLGDKCNVLSGSTATSAKIYVYGWTQNQVSGDSPYFTVVGEKTITYISEWHNLKISKFSMYRNSNNKQSVYYTFTITREKSNSSFPDKYKLVRNDGTSIVSSTDLTTNSTTVTSTTTLGESATATYTLTVWVDKTNEKVEKSIKIGLPKTTLHLAPSANGGLGIGQYADAGSNNTYGRLDVAYPSYFNNAISVNGSIIKNIKTGTTSYISAAAGTQATISVTFPSNETSFSAAPIVITTVQLNDTAARRVYSNVYNVSKTGFTAGIQNDGGSARSVKINWIAIEL